MCQGIITKDKLEFRGHVFFDGYEEHWKPFLDRLNAVKDAAQNLVNALEAEKLGNKKEILGDNLGDKLASSLELSVPNNMSKLEPKIDIKEERVEPVSIWKDVSELEESFCSLLLKGDYVLARCRKNNEIDLVRKNDVAEDFKDYELGGSTYTQFTTFTNFINSFEQMQKDIEELKRKSI